MTTNSLARRLSALATAVALMALAGCQPRPSANSALAGAMHVRSHMPQTRLPLPANTGIPACDAYLSSYLACHRAARIYSAEQLQPRFQQMREILLRESLDPNVRPELAGRCEALTHELRQALHGQPCDGVPQPAASAAH